MCMEEIKHLLETESSTSLDARNNDIVFPERTPRIFTSNVEAPFQWCKGLPDVQHKTPTQRLALCDNDIMAIWKRVCFCHVENRIIDNTRRADFSAAVADSLSRKMARLLK
jgi:hypothetical protein